jgi:hypothetical protein
MRLERRRGRRCLPHRQPLQRPQVQRPHSEPRPQQKKGLAWPLQQEAETLSKQMPFPAACTICSAQHTILSRHGMCSPSVTPLLSVALELPYAKLVCLPAPLTAGQGQRRVRQHSRSRAQPKRWNSTGVPARKAGQARASWRSRPTRNTADERVSPVARLVVPAPGLGRAVALRPVGHAAQLVAELVVGLGGVGAVLRVGAPVGVPAGWPGGRQQPGASSTETVTWQPLVAQGAGAGAGFAQAFAPAAPPTWCRQAGARRSRPR